MRIALLSTIVVLVTTTATLAQHRGSAEDQLACTPDVYRLCSDAIPDEDDIIACLQKHKNQLGPACKVVFSRPPTVAKPDDNQD